MQELDCHCPKCDAEDGLTVTAKSAACNPWLIDIIVECEECGHTLNAFVEVAKMTEIKS